MVRKAFSAALLSFSAAFANYFGSPTMSGNPQSLLSLGSPAMGTPTISPSQFRPGQGPGKMIGFVNGFTGQPSYSVPLGELNARGAVSFPISLNYGGPTRALYEADRSRGADGWIGLGWSLSIPSIAINHKGTYMTADDVYFADLGPFGSGQLLQAAGGGFYLSTNPYIKITPTTGTGEFGYQFIRWSMQLPDGRTLVFGNDDNSRRMGFYSYNVVKAVFIPDVVPTNRFIYRWDLSSISDFAVKNTIQFDYQKFTEEVLPGRAYDRESYVKNIRWNGPGGEAERYEFITNAKGPSEYYPYVTYEAKDDQRPFETRYLDSLKCFKEGVITHAFCFRHTGWLGGTGDTYKRVLDVIDVFRYDNGLNSRQDRGWAFTYNDMTKYYLLNSAANPDGSKVSFTYKVANFTGKEGDVTPGGFVKEDDHNTVLALPTDNAKLLKWKNVSQCDDRFCYTLIKDGDDVADAQGRKEKMYVEIRPNMGNYTDTASNKAVKRFESASTSSTAAELDLIPAGDYFLWVDYKYGSVDVWEWDDGKMVKRTPFSGDPRYASGNFQHNIKVYPGGDYFVVHKTNVRTSGTGAATANEIIVAKRQPGGAWTSFNRNTGACDFDNKGDYGDPVRADRLSGVCLEYNSADIIVAAAQSYFTVTHKGMDVVNLFGLNSIGTVFLNQSHKIEHVGVSSQKSGYPMNFQIDIGNVAAHKDYFVLAAPDEIWALYYAGDTTVYCGGGGQRSGGNKTLWLSDNYFIEKNGLNEFFLWPRSSVTGFYTGKRITTLAPTSPSTKATLVRTHPKGFTIEYYDHVDSIGCRPSVSGTRFAVNLYQVDKSHPTEFVDRSGNLVHEGHLFDLAFGSDDFIFAKKGKNSANGPCAAGQACTIEYYAVPFYPRNMTAFLNLPISTYKVPVTSTVSLKQSQDVLGGARTAMRTVLDLTNRKVRWEPFQWGGQTFGTPTGHYVVDQVTAGSGLGAAARDNVIHQYVYDRQTSWRVEFNSNLQTPQFEACEVKRINSLGANLGGSLTVFNVDVLAKPLGDTLIFLNGVEKYTSTFGASGDTVTKGDQFKVPYRNSNWPNDLFVNRVYKTTEKHVSSNRAYRINYFTRHSYNDNNGSPHFTVSALGSGPHAIDQTLFDATNHLPSQQISFLAAAYPDTNLLRGANTTTPLNAQTGLTSLIPVTSEKTVSNSNFLPVRQETWRDFDDGMSEANMKQGISPVFNLNEGWIPTGEIIRSNGYNQAIETKVVRGTGNESHTSYFYEGRLSLPVATVTNSRLENCAVLMAENYQAGIPKLDYPNTLNSAERWENPSTTIQANRSHTGRASFRVIDGFGPTINMYLKDVRTKGLSMTLSAWIYAENNTTPILAVGRYTASGSLVDVFTGAPTGYGWPEAQNKWQRWTLTLTNAQLINGGLFNGANDYLRIWVGTGEPADPNRKMYVDDIVIMPGDATVTMSTHDFQGFRTSLTANDHKPVFFDLDLRGAVMGTKDHRNRIFSQQGFHFMGEN